MRLHRLPIFREDRAPDPQDQPFIGHVDALDLHPLGLAMEEVAQFLLGEVANRLLRIDEARGEVETRVPAALGVAGDRDRALGERL